MANFKYILSLLSFFEVKSVILLLVNSQSLSLRGWQRLPEEWVNQGRCKGTLENQSSFGRMLMKEALEKILNRKVRVQLSWALVVDVVGHVFSTAWSIQIIRFANEAFFKIHTFWGFCFEKVIMASLYANLRILMLCYLKDCWNVISLSSIWHHIN